MVVAVKDPGDHVVAPTRPTEIGIQKSVPVSDIKTVYLGWPYAVEPGYLDVVQSKHGEPPHTGSGMLPSASLIWSERKTGMADTGKVSKASVNYRKATGSRHCGNCAMFHSGSCDLVEGVIDADDVCKKWITITDWDVVRDIGWTEEAREAALLAKHRGAEVKSYVSSHKVTRAIGHFVDKKIHEIAGHTVEHSIKNQLRGAMKLGIAAIMTAGLTALIHNPYAAFAISEATIEVGEGIGEQANKLAIEAEHIRTTLSDVLRHLHQPTAYGIGSIGDSAADIQIALGQLLRIVERKPPLLHPSYRDVYEDKEEVRYIKGEGGRFAGSEPGFGTAKAEGYKAIAVEHAAKASVRAAIETSTQTPLKGSRGHPGMIATSQAIATKAGVKSEVHPDDYVRVDLDQLRKDPEQFAHVVDLFKVAKNYPMRRNEVRGSTETVLRNVLNRMKDNMQWLYDTTPKAVRDRAAQWYSGGRVLADQYVKDYAKYGLTDTSAAGVIAALSPQKDWNENVYLANQPGLKRQRLAQVPTSKRLPVLLRDQSLWVR